MPPEGEFYGFPKPFPGGANVLYKRKIKWFLDQGYPQELIDQGLIQYCKWYEQEFEEEEERGLQNDTNGPV